MTEQERWKRELAADGFAAWELHVFLDTHPENTAAAAQLEKIRRRHAEHRKRYEEKYGPIGETSRDTSRWAWVTDPWPWEQEDA